LFKAGFEFDPANFKHRQSKYKNTFTRFQLPYTPIAKGEGVLRPEIQIDLSAFPVHRPLIEHPVRSFIAEASDQPAEVAATVRSPDPTAKGAMVPLVSSFMLSTKEGNKAWLEPVIDPKASRVPARRQAAPAAWRAQ
jgi:hypothetical protein